MCYNYVMPWYIYIPLFYILFITYSGNQFEFCIFLCYPPSCFACLKISSMYRSQNSCWTYEDQGYYNCSIFSFQADTVLRVEEKQIKLLEHVQNIYYTQHLYQYKKNTLV